MAIDLKHMYLLTCRMEDQDYPYSVKVYPTPLEGIEAFEKTLKDLAASKVISLGSESETLLRRLSSYHTPTYKNDEGLQYKAKIYAPIHDKSVYVSLCSI